MRVFISYRQIFVDIFLKWSIVCVCVCVCTAQLQLISNPRESRPKSQKLHFAALPSLFHLLFTSTSPLPPSSDPPHPSSTNTFQNPPTHFFSLIKTPLFILTPKHLCFYLASFQIPSPVYFFLFLTTLHLPLSPSLKCFLLSLSLPPFPTFCPFSLEQGPLTAAPESTLCFITPTS